MKSWQGLTCGLALAALALWPVGDALAASVSGRSSTVLEWFDTAGEDTAMPAFQYLQFNALDIADKGYDFRGYGRLGYDLADEVYESYDDSRLYYAYLEKRDFLTEDLDFRLGRQFISTTAGASVMDGLRLDYGFLDNYGLTVFGGGDVAYYEGYNAKDAIVGAEVTGRFLETLDLGFSYVAKFESGLLAQELFGLDVEYDIADILYVYNETQYDYLSDRVSYFLAGAKYHQFANWSARLEYLYSLPVFSSTSIYSVFAVDEYEELMGELTYNFSDGWRAFGRYTREMYVDFDDADVFEAGIEKIRTDKFSGYLTGVYRSDDDGQDMEGFKLYLACLFNRYVQAGAGINLDVYERSINYFDDESDTDDTTSKRYWADMTVYFNKQINLQAKVERIESDLWDYYNRGRVRLNILF